MWISPLAGWANAVQLTLLLAEAQAVIGMRLMGMAGLWNVTATEDRRMVSEKSDALAKSAGDATAALMRGGRPDQIVAAAIRPIRQRTRANARRLSKRSIKKR